MTDTKYVSTLMRIAGNVAPAIYADHAAHTDHDDEIDMDAVAAEAVELAVAIVDGVLRHVARAIETERAQA